MMDALKEFNEKSMNSAKRVGELNLKTFEKLATKQAQLLNSCFETGTKNFEALSKAKSAQDVFSMQQEVMKSCGEKWMANLREAADLLAATREELLAIAEEATKNTTESTAKITELSKQSFTENMEKANAAMSKAMPKTGKTA